jgi:hypothetical protein
MAQSETPEHAGIVSRMTRGQVATTWHLFAVRNDQIHKHSTLSTKYDDIKRCFYFS